MKILASIFGGRFDKGAVTMDAEQVRDAIRRALKGKAKGFDWEPSDDLYLCLTKENYKAMTDYAVRTAGIRWQKGFPDCDDHARIAQGQVLLQAVRSGFDSAPAFFKANVDSNAFGYHARSLAVCADGIVLQFEPQTGKWDGAFFDVSRLRSIEG